MCSLYIDFKNIIQNDGKKNYNQNMTKRWQIPVEPDILLKVLRTKQYTKEKTVSKTALYLIRVGYDHIFKEN